MRIIAISIISASLLVSCGSDSSKDDKKDGEETVIKTNVTSTDAGDLTIGYYDSEKLTTDFTFFKNTSVQLEKEGMAIQQELESWQRKYENAARQLQENYSSLTVAQQNNFDRTIKQSEKMIVSIQQNKMAPYQQKQADLTRVLENKLLKYSEDFANENGIKLLIAKGAGGGISYIDSAFDVTDAFIQYMNAKEKELDAMGEQ